MLTLTTDAVVAIRDLTAQEEPSGETGLRLSTKSDNGAGTSLDASISGGPQLGDEILEAEGARVFVESAIVSYLDDKTLDAEVAQEGGVTFLVTKTMA
ncbi:Fe-S cluster assembly protein HesB [Streptosporangium sp. KLBMP 9127]|nr:Fe-S cluster assembly protein HesB [Streptosporangium sp. KLBMP 9127]MCG5220775.1 Fe-S cluster assembly protein HesB [Streptosporangium sp. KLBMP 9127]